MRKNNTIQIEIYYHVYMVNQDGMLATMILLYIRLYKLYINK